MDKSKSDNTHHKQIRRCVAVEQHLRLIRLDPEYRWRSRMLEQEVQDWVKNYAPGGLRTGLIRIPIVVHVLFNTVAQNISDDQIFSQIEVLNADYRRLNADAGSTPAAFAAVAADARIEFALAVRDPNCNPTTGITRTSTPITGWTFPSDNMKSSATGGVDPWDVTKYLNVWVVNYTDGTLGYGTFPAMPAAIQGVVCYYQSFGSRGTLIAHAALGRTMTHEIGHWLDLHHIWGDDRGACSGSDLVDDTPNQAGASPFGPCRTFPSISCSNGPNGDMFQNYMDYSADECMNIFTAGQVVRMNAALMTARTSILASDALVPLTGVPGPDLWMKDVSDDFGDEPDLSGQPMWISDDIWVRNTNDGIMNQDHQNAEYRPAGSPPNFVYVRVRNRGCSGISTGTLKLYWAKASSGLAWPSPWDGSVTSPALMGGFIGSQSVSVAAGSDEILAFPWMPPNPADYAVFGADQSHFCLLARIETAAAAPFGMTFSETADLYTNVQQNNNIVWKNITIVDDIPGSGRLTTVLVANFRKEREEASISFFIPKEEKISIFDWGKVFVEIPPELVKKVRVLEKEKNVVQIDKNTFEILSPGTFGSFELNPKEIFGVKVYFLPKHKPTIGVRVFALDMIQRNGNRVVGGQRLVLKTMPDTRYIAKKCQDTRFDGVSWIKTSCSCGCH
ncbi:zinc metalloprotease [Mucilaginibacter sp. McL0603]|uniref:zinc metalloprotease n=1 Tax=Mucilaginibacter sp. McL0603 TaxID=3415670 RepID=UPI003CF068F1